MSTPKSTYEVKKNFSSAMTVEKGSVDASLLIVDDDPVIISLLGRILIRYKTIRFATSGEHALGVANNWPPDLILLDAQLGGISGLQVCEALKADKRLKEIPVIFVSGCEDEELECAALKVGAADFIRKPFSPSQIIARVGNQLRLRHASMELQALSRVDGNTGIANKAAFDETLEREIGRAIEASQTLSVLMIEIDFFEKFRDLLGDDAAGECIVSVAKCLVDCAVRPGDFPSSFGGHTFAMILPDTNSDGAMQSANRFLEAVEALDIMQPCSAVSRHVTCSIGVASCATWEQPPGCACTGVDSDDQSRASRCTSEALQIEARLSMEQAKRMGHAQSYRRP